MAIDFKKIKEVKTKSIIVKIELELIDSSLELEEATNRIQQYIAAPNSNGVSELVVGLLRASRASMWELQKIEVI